VFGSDEWPEQERNRRRDAVHKEARYVFVHRDSQENRDSVSVGRGSAEDEEVLGGVPYRFVGEEDVAVLYVYELQVSGARPLGVGRVTALFPPPPVVSALILTRDEQLRQEGKA